MARPAHDSGRRRTRKNRHPGADSRSVVSARKTHFDRARSPSTADAKLDRFSTSSPRRAPDITAQVIIAVSPRRRPWPASTPLCPGRDLARVLSIAASAITASGRTAACRGRRHPAGVGPGVLDVCAGLASTGSDWLGPDRPGEQHLNPRAANSGRRPRAARRSAPGNTSRPALGGVSQGLSRRPARSQ